MKSFSNEAMVVPLVFKSMSVFDGLWSMSIFHLIGRQRSESSERISCFSDVFTTSITSGICSNASIDSLICSPIATDICGTVDLLDRFSGISYWIQPEVFITSYGASIFSISFWRVLVILVHSSITTFGGVMVSNDTLLPSVKCPSTISPTSIASFGSLRGRG